MFRLNQEAAEVELASVASFCESVGTSLPKSDIPLSLRCSALQCFVSRRSSGQFVNDADLANMRAQCHRYVQQIDALQAHMPTDVQKVSR